MGQGCGCGAKTVIKYQCDCDDAECKCDVVEFTVEPVTVPICVCGKPMKKID